MSAPMNKPHIEEKETKIILRFIVNDAIYDIPKEVAEHYKQDIDKASADKIFNKIDKKYTKAGALLKGLRYREGLSQVEFAQKINVTQADLSKMENGHRPIGKIVAKRIEKIFGTDYKYFLE